MATRIDLPKELVKAAFKQRQDSLKRSISNATNTLVKEAYESELKQLNTAIDTIAEIK